MWLEAGSGGKGIVLTKSAVGGFIPARHSGSRKGDNGVVLVVGGSYVYHGAPILSSMAALRSGADLVYTAVPSIHAAAARAVSPSLIVLPMADPKLTRGSAGKLLGMVPKNVDSAAIGMGLVVHEVGALRNMVRSLLDRDVRLSLDAAALVPEVLPIIGDHNVVVTPHAGEFARLFGREPPPPDELDRRVEVAGELAQKHGIAVLLKGPTDIVTDGKVTYLHEKKVPAMTAGGTGDVLSGLVAGLLARNRNPLESAAAAAFVNGEAGMLAQTRFGLHILSEDLIGGIPTALKPFDRMAG